MKDGSKPGLGAIFHGAIAWSSSRAWPEQQPSPSQGGP